MFASEPRISPDADDRELVRASLSGNLKAYETLVRRYQKLVYNMLYQMTHSHEQAADLTQEAFLRAFRGLNGFRTDAPFKPWLLRIATNACLNDLRGRKQVDSLEETLEENPQDEPAARDNVEAEVEQRISQQQLGEALQQLSPRQRQVFVLRYVHDLPYEQIGQITGEPVTTIKPLLFRIRERLRNIMQKECKSSV
ncbi:MAG TPA: RNA polymerase sigma factor [Planktothrix sp.]|jgi:RNA polymerase sigma-70 factor (ECF subfamily)